MEPVGDLHLGDEPVREPERDERAGCREQREAPRLEAPERAVGVELPELLVDPRDVRLRRAGLLELPDGLGGEILELDAIGVAAGRRIGGHVDRDAGRVPVRQQSIDLAAGGMSVCRFTNVLLVAGDRLQDAMADA